MLWTRRIARPFTPPHHVHTVLHRLMPPHHPLCSTSSPPRRMSGTRRGGETAEERAARKAAIKADKAHKRAVREGKLATVDPDYGKKPCDLCGKLVDLLIRYAASSFIHGCTCDTPPGAKLMTAGGGAWYAGARAGDRCLVVWSTATSSTRTTGTLLHACCDAVSVISSDMAACGKTCALLPNDHIDY